MRTIRIASDISTSAIGFGCSGLLGGNSKEEALSLLETAYELGIRHFDVARYYGYGDAEKILGEFAQSKRGTITITSKFGIMPDARIANMKGAISIARKVMRHFSWAKQLIRKNVRTVVQDKQFDVSTVKKSVEDSLSSLKTERIDILLLHEAHYEDCSDDLCELLQSLKQAGKIREFGVGTDFSKIDGIIQNASSFANILQFNSNVIDKNIEKITQNSAGRNSEIITHGSFSCLQEIQSLHPDLETKYLSNMLLSYSLHKNPNGIVIFRTNNLTNLRANIDFQTNTPVSEEELQRFLAIL
jgi:D-threo-aldose 1-dehydrogenase